MSDDAEGFLKNIPVLLIRSEENLKDDVPNLPESDLYLFKCDRLFQKHAKPKGGRSKLCIK